MRIPRRDRYLYWERMIDKVLGSILLNLLAPPTTREVASAPDRFPSIGRILAIKLHGIGNTVMLAPALESLAAAYPDARIDLVTFESNKAIAEALPGLSEAFFIRRTSLAALAVSTARLLRKARGAGYDMVVDFEQFAYYSALIAVLSEAPLRVGFDNPTHSRRKAYNVPVVYSETDHMSRIFSRLAMAAGGSPVPARAPRLELSEHHAAEASSLLRTMGIPLSAPLVLLHPGSSPNLILRRWPAERFASLGKLLRDSLGAAVLVGGDREEEALAQRVVDLMEGRAVSVAGRLSLLGYTALCGMCSVVVSNDTAAVHLASAVGATVAGIYGPNTPFLYGPVGKRHLTFYHPFPCSPCLKNVNRKLSDCIDARCIESIGVDEVYQAIAGAGLVRPAAAVVPEDAGAHLRFDASSPFDLAAPPTDDA